jgi:mannose-6-phosphate isomerase
MNFDKSIPLKCQIQHYAWGSSGEQAFLNQLMSLNQNYEPLAELWMGAHPKAPALAESISLHQLIQSDSLAILGEDSVKIWGKTLPYLFKVLCADDALSIQLHPNKSEAEALHAKDPKHYPDDNHKPEIAIALDQLEALIGFEEFSQLVSDLENYPEITEFIGNETYQQLQQSLNHSNAKKLEVLKKAFMKLNLNALNQQEELQQLNQKLYEKILKNGARNPKESWYLKLYPKYPNGDVGLFVLFFLNYRVLHQGEAVFLKADVPHAYLKGNIIECMANSDNVVRAGLTPKFVDVETLAKITQYELAPLAIQSGEENGLGGVVYKTPVQEFEVHFFETSDQSLNMNLNSWQGASIGLVLKGQLQFENETNVYQKGDVFLISDQAKLKAKLSKNSQVCFARPSLSL